MIGRCLAGGAALAGAVLAAGLAWAGQAHLDGFRQECENQNDASLPCECFVDAAATYLNDIQQASLYAQAIADEAEIRRLADAMTADEIAGVEDFMRGIAAICPPRS